MLSGDFLQLHPEDEDDEPDGGVSEGRAMQARAFFHALSQTSAESQRAMLNLIHASSVRCEIIDTLALHPNRVWSNVVDERRLVVLGKPPE